MSYEVSDFAEWKRRYNPERCPTCGNRREWPVLAVPDNERTAHLESCPDPFHRDGEG